MVEQPADLLDHQDIEKLLDGLEQAFGGPDNPGPERSQSVEACFRRLDNRLRHGAEPFAAGPLSILSPDLQPVPVS